MKKDSTVYCLNFYFYLISFKINILLYMRYITSFYSYFGSRLLTQQLNLFT